MWLGRILVHRNRVSKCSLLIKVAKTCRLLLVVWSRTRIVLSSVPSVRMTAPGMLWLRFGKAKDIMKVLGMGRHQGGIVLRMDSA